MPRDHAQRSQGNLRQRPVTRRQLLGASGAAMGLAATGPLGAWAAPARQEPVTLNFITQSDEWGENMMDVVAAFEAANPSIKVELETYPFRQLFEIIEIRMEGQSTDVDLISVDVPLVASYSVRGFLQPLNEYFTPEEMEGTWVPASVEAGHSGDQFMAAPQNTSTQLLYYRRRASTIVC